MNFRRERISCLHEAAVHTKWLHLTPNRRLIENERKDRIGKTLKMIVTRRGSRPASLYQADS